jgi:hypothetical protein
VPLGHAKFHKTSSPTAAASAAAGQSKQRKQRQTLGKEQRHGHKKRGAAPTEQWVCFKIKTSAAQQRLHLVGREKVREVYGFSSLVKQNKKGKNCAVFCFAGKR